MTLVSGLLLSTAVHAQGFDKLKKAIGDLHVADDWIYEDIAAGYATAKKTGKPLLVVFR